MDAPKNTKMNVNVDYRFIVLGLLAVIVTMLLVWKPWQPAKTSDRTVEVSGQVTLSARPDEFVFYPTYDFENADKQAAIKELGAKSDEMVAKLKDLGVASGDIKVNSDAWAYPTYGGDTGKTPTYTLRLTITVHNDELTQKVQDYLLGTSPSGTISPQATFSEQKRKELEGKARDQASKDARAKAEQSAKNLGFKLAAVKTVNDGAGFGGGIYPATDRLTTMEATATAAPPSLTVQPGENDFTYSVTVTYFIK